jgi:hypothetical protein
LLIKSSLIITDETAIALLHKNGKIIALFAHLIAMGHHADLSVHAFLGIFTPPGGTIVKIITYTGAAMLPGCSTCPKGNLPIAGAFRLF